MIWHHDAAAAVPRHWLKQQPGEGGIHGCSRGFSSSAAGGADWGHQSGSPEDEQGAGNFTGA